MAFHGRTLRIERDGDNQDAVADDDDDDDDEDAADVADDVGEAEVDDLDSDSTYHSYADHGVMMPLYYQEFIPEGVPQVCRTWTTQDRSETYALENTT